MIVYLRWVNMKLSRNRRRGHVPQKDNADNVMDQNPTSGEFGLPTSTERAFLVKVDYSDFPQFAKWDGATMCGAIPPAPLRNRRLRYLLRSVTAPCRRRH